MNINKTVDKAYLGKSLNEVLAAPVGALKGLSEGDAAALKQAFNVTTVADLANCKFFLWAQAIQTLAATEE
ncbi:MAG: hypothetical protein PHE17_12205 [Thiothrix sp.]|uniref:hypothetical protein n=1 Tax=Thiothrix sp. TaxID=1032 RepID=UPI0026194AC1|nr:hypothetical protein [Thiothrix sp.]MDD5393772.1 hypothetical protein [Thiothrix sp.]